MKSRSIRWAALIAKLRQIGGIAVSVRCAHDASTFVSAPVGKVTEIEKTDGSEGERQIICDRVLQVDCVRL
jgi:hypothetical protein